MLNAWRALEPRIQLLFVLAGANALAFAAWQALLNNFAVERAAFDGAEIGVLQSAREVPGFLAFTAVWVLLVLSQQRFALLSLALLGLGTAVTGLLPSFWGLLFTTVVMSVGFHYLETLNTSLTLQWVPKAETAVTMGRLTATRSGVTLGSLGVLYLLLWGAGIDYAWLYAGAGMLAVAAALWAALRYPLFREDTPQRKELVLRRRYWLYYLLTFLSGARRQIFVVFAGFLLVEKFGLPIETMVMLFLVNAALTTWLAPRIGALIARIGERHALTLEYTGLVIVFTAYAFVDTIWLAIALYLVDHVFFSMAIAIKTYFQKIADPGDIASTAGISFTINHVAAVVLPVGLGALWLESPALVFLTGSTLALVSLLSAQLIPDEPAPGAEIRRADSTAPLSAAP
ncbi:MAG: MFS transporter [Pseudomonadales bacterium]|nr:MFS transporter [Pseudomonadales bacterium]